MKKLLYISAACLAGFIGLTAFDGEKPEDLIAARLQTKIDEYNAAKALECDAKVEQAAKDSIAAMPVAAPVAPAKGGSKSNVKAPVKGGTTQKGQTPPQSPVTPTPPVKPSNPKDSKLDKINNGTVSPEATQKKTDKMDKVNNGTVSPAATEKKSKKMDKINSGGGGQ